MSDSVERFVQPEIVLSHFHLRPGETVADFGAGRGYFLPHLSRAVEASGLVYAIEVQKNLVEAAGDTVRQEGLENVRVQWCDLEEENGTRLQTNGIDAGCIINTLFQLEDKPAALTEIARTLVSGGRLFVIDWSESFNHLGPEPAAVVTETDVRALVETAGLVFERSFDAGAHHYGLAFRKP